MEKEIYYAIHEAIQVMEHYNTGEDFALVSSLRRMHELEQKLQQHSVMQGLPSRNLLDECWRSAFTAFIDCCKTKTEFNSETEFNKYYTELSTKLQGSPAVGQRSVDTVAERWPCPYANHDLHLKLFGYCNACKTRIERSSHEGQP